MVANHKMAFCIPTGCAKSFIYFVATKLKLRSMRGVADLKIIEIHFVQYREP
jgi:hypothetical protein